MNRSSPLCVLLSFGFILGASRRPKSSDLARILAAFSAFFLVCSAALAQVYVCPSGPGASEIQVGVTPGPTPSPLCSPRGSENGPYRAAPPTDFWTVVVVGGKDDATIGKDWNVYVGNNYTKKLATERDLLADCDKDMYANCRVVSSRKNECSTIAISTHKNSHFAVGTGYTKEEAAKAAIDGCNQVSDGYCQVIYRPFCSGPHTNEQDSDVVPLALRSEEGERWSGQFDDRDYWGLLAQSASTAKIYYVVDYPSVAQAEALLGNGAQNSCADCATLQIFKNTCAGYSYTESEKQRIYFKLNVDPDKARVSALQACRASSGKNCVGGVYCAGRRYFHADR